MNMYMYIHCACTSFIPLCHFVFSSPGWPPCWSGPTRSWKLSVTPRRTEMTIPVDSASTWTSILTSRGIPQGGTSIITSWRSPGSSNSRRERETSTSFTSCWGELLSKCCSRWTCQEVLRTTTMPARVAQIRYQLICILCLYNIDIHLCTCLLLWWPRTCLFARALDDLLPTVYKWNLWR